MGSQKCAATEQGTNITQRRVNAHRDAGAQQAERRAFPGDRVFPGGTTKTEELGKTYNNENKKLIWK